MFRLILRGIRGCCSGAQSDALLHAGSQPPFEWYVAFIKTQKRDYIRILALTNAEIALWLLDGWIED